MRTKKQRSLGPKVSCEAEAGYLDVLASIRRGLVQAREGAGRTVDEVFDGLEQETQSDK
jgi:hypothetical protein